MITVILADDHPPFLVGVRQALDKAPNIHIVGEAGQGAELFSLLLKHPETDILLLDIQMPGFDVFKAVRKLSAQYAGLKIIIVTGHADHRYIHGLIRMGVRGYMLKDEDLSTYVRAVRIVAGGQTYFSPRVATVALMEDGQGAIILSPRETEVLSLVAAGLTSTAIGTQLGISSKTVDTHAERAVVKLGASNRAAAVGRAVELGMISALPEPKGDLYG